MSEASLYEDDLVLWSERQARLPRGAAARQSNEAIDWEIVPEEIETLGRSERREVASLVRLILVHLLKIEFSPAIEPKGGWRRSVPRARSDLAERLAASPSIGPEPPGIIARQWPPARLQAGTELEIHAEFDAAGLARYLALAFAEAEILGDAP